MAGEFLLLGDCRSYSSRLTPTKGCELAISLLHCGWSLLVGIQTACLLLAQFTSVCITEQPSLKNRSLVHSFVSSFMHACIHCIWLYIRQWASACLLMIANGWLPWICLMPWIHSCNLGSTQHNKNTTWHNTTSAWYVAAAFSKRCDVLVTYCQFIFQCIFLVTFLLHTTPFFFLSHYVLRYFSSVYE